VNTENLESAGTGPARGESDRGLLRRFHALRWLARWLLPEYRFKWPQLGWWRDQAFNDYLARFGELHGNNTDRRYAVQQLLRLVAGVPGDTAEVGAYQGAMSWLILSATGDGRRHHVFDSFEGLSVPGPRDGSQWQPGALACSEDVVRDNLAGFGGRFETYRGWVPTRFSEVAERRFAFVHIDVDLYQPTLDSLTFFFPRMSPGGIIVCDDYNFTSCPGATRAVEEYFSGRPEKMVGLSGGGGFLIKGVATA
jgi:O-methyltransferase